MVAKWKSLRIFFFGTFLGIILNCVLILPMYYRLHHRRHFGGVKFTNSTTRKWTAWVILVLDQFKLPSLSSWKCNTHKNRVLLQNFARKFFCLSDLLNRVKTSIKVRINSHLMSASMAMESNMIMSDEENTGCLFVCMYVFTQIK